MELNDAVRMIRLYNEIMIGTAVIRSNNRDDKITKRQIRSILLLPESEMIL